MTINELKKFFYRRKKVRNKFFKDISIKDNLAIKILLGWIYRLETLKDIRIDNFSYLFSEFSKFYDITFPIKIYYNGEFIITDSKGDEYYFICPIYFIDNTVYSIGQRNDLYDIELDYEITDNNQIYLKTLEILLLDDLGRNTENMVSFYFGSDITKVAFHNLIISYSGDTRIINKKISEYLFTLSDKKCINDIFSIFLDIIDILDIKENISSLSIKSLNENTEILSEIKISDNIVKKYIYTKQLSEYEFQTYHIFPLKDKSEFISDYSKFKVS